jgi:hypothetical protein
MKENYKMFRELGFEKSAIRFVNPIVRDSFFTKAFKAINRFADSAPELGSKLREGARKFTGDDLVIKGMGDDLAGAKSRIGEMEGQLADKTRLIEEMSSKKQKGGFLGLFNKTTINNPPVEKKKSLFGWGLGAGAVGGLTVGSLFGDKNRNSPYYPQ